MAGFTPESQQLIVLAEHNLNERFDSWAAAVASPAVADKFKLAVFKQRYEVTKAMLQLEGAMGKAQ